MDTNKKREYELAFRTTCPDEVVKISKSKKIMTVKSELRIKITQL